MPWHCPACNSIILHTESDPKPRVGERYRCHVCRLALELDGQGDKLTIPPIEADHDVAPVKTPRVRVIPAPIAERRAPTRQTVERRTAQRRTEQRRKAERRKTSPAAKARRPKARHK